MTRLAAYALSSIIAISALANTDLIIFTEEFSSTRFAEPGSTAMFTVFIRNNGTDAAQNVTLTVPLPPGSTLQTLQPPDGWTCKATDAQVVCTIATLPPSGFTSSPAFVKAVVLLSPDPNGFIFDATATITSDTPDSIPLNNETRVFTTVYRLMRVNTTADSGPGSLRAAIEEANARCAAGVPCKIKLDVPRYSTFEPLTPLPAIEAGLLAIEGNSGRSGDRAFELSGARLTHGTGLNINSTADPHHQLFIQIADLAINNFPDYGVAVTGPGDAIVYLMGLFIGTDITGTVARPNGRGIAVDAPRIQLHVGGNVISGNTHSGIFGWNLGTLWLSDSLIGVGSDGRALGNGNSGVFAYRGSMDISGTTIANNGQFGVSIEPNAPRASIAFTNIFANGILGIDWGLDGPGSSPIVPPLISDAIYDPAKIQTVITGTIAATSPLMYVEIFASRARNNAGRAEGEHGIARVPPFGQTFTARVPGDFRGQIITATLSTGPYADSVPLLTSEFSEGVVAH